MNSENAHAEHPENEASRSQSQISQRIEEEEIISMPEAAKHLIKPAVYYSGSVAVVMFGNFLGVYYISSLGPTSLAANNLAYAMQNWSTTMVTSSMSAFSSIAGRYIGNQAESEVGELYRVNYCTSLLLGLPSVILMLVSRPFFFALQQDEQIVNQIHDYFNGYVIGVPAVYGLAANRRFALSVQHMPTAFLFDVLYQLIDTPLSYALIHGKYGFPNLGFAGLAYANTLSSWLIFILSTSYYSLSTKFSKYEFNRFRCERFGFHLKEMLKMGLPIFFRVALELGAMFATNVLIGSKGYEQSAAQEVVLQYATFSLIPTYGIMDACCMLMSKSLGEGRYVNAKNYYYISVILGVMFSLLIQLTLVFNSDFFIEQFIPEQNANQTDIIKMAGLFLQINALNTPIETTRSITSTALTAFKTVEMPAWITLATQLLIFAPLSWGLGFETDLQATGIIVARAGAILVGMLAFVFLLSKQKAPIQNNPNRFSFFSARENQPLIPDSHEPRIAVLQNS